MTERADPIPGLAFLAGLAAGAWLTLAVVVAAVFLTWALR